MLTLVPSPDDFATNIKTSRASEVLGRSIQWKVETKEKKKVLQFPTKSMNNLVLPTEPTDIRQMEIVTYTI